MEPISELATRITSHLWLLHELHPYEADVSEILANPWRADMEQAAARDWSVLQLLLDLTGEVDPPRHGLVWALLHPKLAAKIKQNGTGKPPVNTLAAKAVSVIAERMDTVAQQGLGRALTFAARCRNSAGEDESQISPTQLLTREELFENVANWLLNRDVSQLKIFADAFLRDERFLMEEEISRCAREIKKDTAKRADWKEADEWLQETKARADETRMLVLDRLSLRALCQRWAVPVPFSMVLSDELDEIARSRLLRLHGQKANPGDPPDAAEARRQSDVPVTLSTSAQQAFKGSLFGVALSGGGIRSATFGLGILQGMADRNLLPYIDVLSTVSGGGYIGSWLTAWIKRLGGVDAVQQSLRGSASMLKLERDCPERRPAEAGPDLAKPLQWVSRNSDPHSDHVRPIRLLRDYSRYLAPQGGFFSADAWTIATTWFRNTTLNMLVLVLFFGAALLLPRLAIFALQRLGDLVRPHLNGTGMLVATVIASTPLLLGCLLIRFRNLNRLPCGNTAGKTKGNVSQGDNDSNVVFRILPCIWLGAFLDLVVVWGSFKNNINPMPVAAVFGMELALAIGILAVGTRSPDQERVDLLSGVGQAWRIFNSLVALTMTVIVGALFVYALYAGVTFLLTHTKLGVWAVGSAGLAIVLALVFAVVMVLIGLLGRDLPDEHREWWSRLGAWLGLSVCAWLAICGICFFMPFWIAILGAKTAAAGISWLAVTGAGLKFAFSPHSGHDDASANQTPLKTMVMNIAPAVFVAGLLSAEAFGLFWAVERLVQWLPALKGDSVAQLRCASVPLSFHDMQSCYWPSMHPGSLASLFLLLGFIAACFYIASRVDVNEFSMHNFYKNRLVRAYLGASRARTHRMPNAFTGFDPDDDIRFDRFQYRDHTEPRDASTDCRASYGGPFPIINTALNITRGEELGIQERKAESFVFTPLWSGFDFSRRQASVRKTTLSEFAFQRTEMFGTPGQGAMMGTAMAISGAAFNANAGFHTVPAIAFLLTVFGVRLGWWAGNPRTRNWSAPSPGFGLLYLLKELTANTGTNEDFVLLSDGGHFENMGLYELIRRRCRFIIISDAEEDEKFKLEGIGGAIRKCRDDFGVVIDLSLDALQPIGEPGVSRLHYSLGTVIYPGECKCGKLIYIKSSVTGDEPVDVIEFRKRHSEFPHTSTVNQFFDESHFESYRALGHHVAAQVFTQNLPPLPLTDGRRAADILEEFFGAIEKDLAIRLKVPIEDSAKMRSAVVDRGHTEEGTGG